jgi:hypothetical protein
MPHHVDPNMLVHPRLTGLTCATHTEADHRSRALLCAQTAVAVSVFDFGTNTLKWRFEKLFADNGSERIFWCGQLGTYAKPGAEPGPTRRDDRPPCRHPDKKTHARFNGQPRPRSTTQSENFYKCKHKRQQRNETHSLVILHLVACEMVWIVHVRVATGPMCCRRKVLSYEAIGCKRNTGHRTINYCACNDSIEI